jgi:hypothetical protein
VEIHACTLTLYHAFACVFTKITSDWVVREKTTTYRGAVLDDDKLVDNYKKDATIITTTFLSTSINPDVVKMFNEAPEYMNKISVFFTYNINNTHRRTALNLEGISDRPYEKEVLILRYVPFTIRSVERENDGRRIKICLDECPGQCTVEETRV